MLFATASYNDRQMSHQLLTVIAEACRRTKLMLMPGVSLFLGGPALMLAGHTWTGVCALDFGAFQIAVWAFRPLDRG